MGDTQTAIFVKLKTVMATILKLDISEVDEMTSAKSSLKDDLGIDSVESLDFLASIENMFSITIFDHEAPDLRTVQDVIDLIIKKQTVQ